MGLADDLLAGVADAGHTGIAAQGAILPGLDAVQDGLAVVERVLIVADHRLFEARWLSSRSVTRVSSAATKSARPKVAATRGGMSSRLPIGVATRYKVPGNVKTPFDVDIIVLYLQ